MIVIEVNFMLIVTVAVIAAMLLRYAWFSPQAFGKEWMKLAHVTKTALEKDKRNRFMTTCFAYFAIAITLFTIINWSEAKTAASGAMVGIWLGCGIGGMSLLLSFLWEGRSIKLFLITAGHLVVSIIVMCMLMAHMIGAFSLR